MILLSFFLLVVGRLRSNRYIVYSKLLKSLELFRIKMADNKEEIKEILVEIEETLERSKKIRAEAKRLFFL